MAAEVKAEAAVGDLLTSLARNTGTLVQQEVRLAGVEMSAKLQTATHGLGIIAVAGAIAHLGMLAILVAIVAGLSPFIPVWLSSGVLGVGAMALGIYLIRTKLNSLGRLNPVPTQTIETLKDDKLWVKEQLP